MTTIRYIDLNADLGERPEAADSDAELLRHVTSANVACGGHAGDTETMRRTLEFAKQFGVAAGAHPSYPDRKNFGRIEVNLTAAELERTLSAQIEALMAVAETVGVRVRHVKPHGALYHSANRNLDVARVIAKVICALDATMIVVGQAASPVLPVYRDMGLRTAAEAFADRAYEANGTLRNRQLAGALLENPKDAAKQALNIVVHGGIESADGGFVSMRADTLCIHSDTPNSVAIAREIRRVLSKASVQFRSLK